MIVIVTFLLLLLIQTARACSTGLLVGGTTTGLVFLEAENFFRFFLSNANPLLKPCDKCSAGLGGTGVSKLGLESEGLSVILSSDAGLLLWLCEWLWPLSRQCELHTESSDRDLPINRDTFPVLAASINVPHRLLCEGVLFKWNLIIKTLWRRKQVGINYLLSESFMMVVPFVDTILGGRYCAAMLVHFSWSWIEDVGKSRTK